MTNISNECLWALSHGLYDVVLMIHDDVYRLQRITGNKGILLWKRRGIPIH